MTSNSWHVSVILVCMNACASSVELLVCSILPHKSIGSLVVGRLNNWSNLKFTSTDFPNFSAFGYKTVHIQCSTRTVASKMQNTPWYCHCTCFNLFKIAHEVMKGFINSYGDSQTSHTFKEQEYQNCALGCWKVIIIWDLPLQCTGKVRNIMHCNAWFYISEQFEANGTHSSELSKDRKTRGQDISWRQ